MSKQPIRTALVTGANKGIGLEVARQLGLQGFRTIIASRNLALGEMAAQTLVDIGLDARSVQIDVTDVDSIEKAATNISSNEAVLDVLVNNAGVGDPADGRPTNAQRDAVRRILETNFLGALAVTQAMLPLLRKSSAGRIVNQSSGLGSLTHNSNVNWEFAAYKLIGYSASKAALNMLTVHLAAELKAEGIAVNSADPGFTATDLNQHRGTQTVEEGAAAAVRLALGADGHSTGTFRSANQTEPW